MSKSLNLLIISMLALSGNAYAASAEPMDVDVDILQKIAKEKTKNQRDKIDQGGGSSDDAGSGSNSSGSSGSSSSCGNVDIGNSAPTTGAGQFSNKTTTVIVTGPVINANNNCK